MSGGSGQGDTVRFEDHIRFDCRMCGACCREVQLLLTPYDVWSLARELGISTGRFLDEYAILALIPRFGKRIRVYLEPILNGPCPFLKGALCGVYRARPVSCRLYPLSLYVGLWNDGQTHFGSWGLVRGVIRDCPGIDDDADQTTVRAYLDGQVAAEGLAAAIDYGEFLNHLYLHYSVPEEDEHSVKMARNLFDLDRYSGSAGGIAVQSDFFRPANREFGVRYAVAKSETLLRFKKKPVLKG